VKFNNAKSSSGSQNRLYTVSPDSARLFWDYEVTVPVTKSRNDPGDIGQFASMTDDTYEEVLYQLKKCLCQVYLNRVDRKIYWAIIPLLFCFVLLLVGFRSLFYRIST
jgi:hypothetical protein